MHDTQTGNSDENQYTDKCTHISTAKDLSLMS